MNIYGVVAEYNPFHCGHKYHTDMMRNDGCDAVVAVMGGCYTQRGGFSIMPRREKTLAALYGGCDLVLALPVTSTVAPAQLFSRGGIGILGALGCVKKISFGSECGDISILKQCAAASSDCRIDELIAGELSAGCTYPAARQAAVKAVCGCAASEALSNPNDTLAVEYISAAAQLAPNADFLCVKRRGAGHNSGENDIYCSASRIREDICAGIDVSNTVPASVNKIIKECRADGRLLCGSERADAALMYALRRMTQEAFARLPDISEGLENRIYNAVRSGKSVDEILNTAKTKRFTMARLRRILMYAYLGITDEMRTQPQQYVHVLGFNEKGREALTEIKKTCALPIVTGFAEAKALGSKAAAQFELECRAEDLYSLLLPNPTACGSLMTDSVVKLTDTDRKAE